MGLYKVPCSACTTDLGAGATNDHVNASLKGSVLLVLRWMVTYLSSDWTVRLGSHPECMSDMLGWIVPGPLWTLLYEGDQNGPWSGQPIRLIALGTDVVAELALGDHKWSPAYETLGLTKCVWPWGISVALRPLWVGLASPCWCGAHAPHLSSQW